MEAKGGVLEQTCLTIAAYNSHLTICRLLLEKGAQLETKDSAGKTPLHWAAFQDRVEIVRFLCDRGADVEACDIWRWRPLHYAANYGSISVLKELIEERNADINARANGGSTALRFARNNNKPAIAAYLISHEGTI